MYGPADGAPHVHWCLARSRAEDRRMPDRPLPYDQPTDPAKRHSPP